MLNVKPSKKLIYLDYAATTPVRPEVLRAMQPFWSQDFGNPSSLYKAGLVAKRAIDTSRKTVAGILNARPQEIIFTAGGSESINLAILGAARKYRETHKTGGHIITSSIEHHAVLHSVNQLEKEGFKVTRIKVDRQGFFDLNELEKSFRKDTVLVSLMYANNEIGTIEPIREIAGIIRNANAKRLKLATRNSQFETILFHTDACQAAGFLDIDVNHLGVDLFSINGSKIYGPKQTGCLYVRGGVSLQPIIFGGGQERDVRSGTENVPGIVGFARALELAQKERTKESKRLADLRDYLISKILKIVPSAVINGPRKDRLPNNVNVTLPNAEGEAVMLYLDGFNVAVATGSACTSESTEPSHVLKAIGASDADARASVRITLGKYTTRQELDYLLRVLPDVVKTVRGMEKLS